ncbi:MAG: type II secretion system F family protein [bacterium]
MPFYSYTARSSQGKTVTGSMEAANQSLVVRMLRDQGLTPTTIQSGGLTAASAVRKRKVRRGRIKLEDIVVFARQLATMIRAGLPLIEVLNILGEQMEKAQFKEIVKQVERDVSAGSSFTEGMQKHKIFDNFFISMVRAGEASGMLDQILDQVAHYLEKRASLQRKIKSAVMYPSVVSIVACGITVFLLVKVVPVFEDIFGDLGGELPLPTKVTLGLSKFLQQHYIIFAGIIIAAAVFIWQWGRTKHGRYQIDNFKLKMPVFGPIFLKAGVAKFTRTLGTLVKSGVNILTALEIVAKTSGNTLIEEAILRTRTSIQSGESISKPLTESGVFPPMVTRMIEVGERTGALESMLTKIAEFYEDQVDAAVNGLTSIIEPLLIVFLGVVVGFIVISMFMPMFKMVQMIQ